jgi:hypothetical protein
LLDARAFASPDVSRAPPASQARRDGLNALVALPVSAARVRDADATRRRVARPLQPATTHLQSIDGLLQPRGQRSGWAGLGVERAIVLCAGPRPGPLLDRVDRDAAAVARAVIPPMFSMASAQPAWPSGHNGTGGIQRVVAAGRCPRRAGRRPRRSPRAHARCGIYLSIPCIAHGRSFSCKCRCCS